MLSGWEWIIIGVVAIVIIMWGPSKIPDLAKALGRAKGEFSKAQKEFADAATETENTKTVAKNPIKSKDEMLLDTAHNMGISTEGKTKEQITEEVALKVKSLGADNA